MAKATVTKAERDHQIEQFKACVQDGDTLFFILKHISASGMARFYDVYAFPVIDGKVEPRRFTYTASMFVGSYDRKHDAVRINGCGFSGEQEICEALAEAAFGNRSKLEYRRLG